MSSRDAVGLQWWRVQSAEEVAVNDVWPLVHAERAALVGDLESLDDGQWEEPSLCSGWTVHDVVAHLVDTARTTRLGFLLGLAGARFDFDRQNARGVERERCASPRDTLERLRQAAARTSTPPAPLDSRLVEEIVHGEDIRRPLGIARSYPREAVVRSLRLQVRTPASFGGARELVARTRLTASDAGLSIGEGPEVCGPALSLLLAVSRRRVALDDLGGPGLSALAAGI
uniref:Mycothiol-dependent maleylpyruvate isomerase metal-binding domain-containing protein n=1 Tax=Streptomyces pratensis (strain ATCC 33331 / IAF-45CD) TaxID=591167 RepID=A0A8D3WD38_STRFA|nr:maleylpyruvate isomerase family mycothiol-dependent enzyme [Streptomyces sp. SID7815]